MGAGRKECWAKFGPLTDDEEAGHEGGKVAQQGFRDLKGHLTRRRGQDETDGIGPCFDAGLHLFQGTKSADFDERFHAATRPCAAWVSAQTIGVYDKAVQPDAFSPPQEQQGPSLRECTSASTCKAAALAQVLREHVDRGSVASMPGRWEGDPLPEVHTWGVDCRGVIDCHRPQMKEKMGKGTEQVRRHEGLRREPKEFPEMEA